MVKYDPKDRTNIHEVCNILRNIIKSFLPNDNKITINNNDNDYNNKNSSNN